MPNSVKLISVDEWCGGGGRQNKPRGRFIMNTRVEPID